MDRQVLLWPFPLGEGLVNCDEVTGCKVEFVGGKIYMRRAPKSKWQFTCF